MGYKHKAMLRRIIAHIAANSIALYFVNVILQSELTVTGGLKGYLIAGIIFGFLNGIVKPILKILSLPFVLMTAGLFIFLINTFLIWFAQYSLNVLDFSDVAIVTTGGFFTYLLAGFLMSIFNGFIGWLLKK